MVWRRFRSSFRVQFRSNSHASKVSYGRVVDQIVCVYVYCDFVVLVGCCWIFVLVVVVVLVVLLGGICCCCGMCMLLLIESVVVIVIAMGEGSRLGWICEGKRWAREGKKIGPRKRVGSGVEEERE